MSADREFVPLGQYVGPVAVVDTVIVPWNAAFVGFSWSWNSQVSALEAIVAVKLAPAASMGPFNSEHPEPEAIWCETLSAFMNVTAVLGGTVTV